MPYQNISAQLSAADIHGEPARLNGHSPCLTREAQKLTRQSRNVIGQDQRVVAEGIQPHPSGSEAQG